MSEHSSGERELFANPDISNAEKHQKFVDSGKFDELPAVKPEVGTLVVTRDDTKAYEIKNINDNGTVEIGYATETKSNFKTVSLTDIRLASDVGNALFKIRGYDTVLGYEQRKGNTYLKSKIQNN